MLIGAADWAIDVHETAVAWRVLSLVLQDGVAMGAMLVMLSLVRLLREPAEP